MRLTHQDIKILKYEKRIGFVFAGLILTFASLFNLIYIVLNLEKNWSLLALLNSGIIILSYFTASFINKNINKDLRECAKIVKTEKIKLKKKIKDYEVGSGALYIPILGDLFPKLWGQKMKEYYKYIIILGNTEHRIEKELFENIMVGELIEIHYSKYSDIVLEIKKSE